MKTTIRPCLYPKFENFFPVYIYCERFLICGNTLVSRTGKINFLEKKFVSVIIKTLRLPRGAAAGSFHQRELGIFRNSFRFCLLLLEFEKWLWLSIKMNQFKMIKIEVSHLIGKVSQRFLWTTVNIVQDFPFLDFSKCFTSSHPEVVYEKRCS